MKQKLFISYAHEDADMLRLLRNALRPALEPMDVIVFTDHEMTAGTEYHERLKAECLGASAVIFLVSNAFLKSRYCQSFEVTWAMRKDRILEAALIPVILETCDWRGSAMRHLRATPPDGKPVQHYDTLETGFAVVAAEIADALNDTTKPLWTGSAALSDEQFVYRTDGERGPALGSFGGALHEMKDGLTELGELLHIGEHSQSGGHHSDNHTPHHDHATHHDHDDDHHSDDDDDHHESDDEPD